MTGRAAVVLLLSFFAAKGDDVDCPWAETGACGLSGSSMVQLKSDLKSKRILDQSMDKDVQVNIFVKTQQGKDLALTYAKPGMQVTELKKLHALEIVLNSTAYSELCGGAQADHLLCEEDIPGLFHVFVHEMGTAQKLSKTGEVVPYGITMVRGQELPPLPAENPRKKDLRCGHGV